MKKVLVLAVAAMICAFGVQKATAQSPDQQLGVGVTVGSGFTGGQIGYAITPGLHLGGLIGLAFGSTSQTVQNVTASSSFSEILIGAYGKFIFKGSSELKPYIHGALVFSSRSQEVGNNQTTSVDGIGLWISGGAEYFITPNFGIFGQIRVVDLPLTASDGASKTTIIGIGAPAIGAEWFL